MWLASATHVTIQGADQNLSSLWQEGVAPTMSFKQDIAMERSRRSVRYFYEWLGYTWGDHIDQWMNMYSDRQMQSLNQSNPSTDKNHKIGILMPLEMSITMDGISGILPYSAFLLPNDRLPPRYRNRVAFIVFSINHELDNNQWKVTLRGKTIMRPDTDPSVITN